MKITQARTRVLRTPADYPLVEGIPVGDATRDFITLELDTDEGIQGIGFSFIPGAVGNPLTTALKITVDSLGELVIGGRPDAGGGNRQAVAAGGERRRAGPVQFCLDRH